METGRTYILKLVFPEEFLVTGYPTIQTALRAKRLGAFEYVTKPFTRQELRSVVVRGLRVHKNLDLPKNILQGLRSPAAVRSSPFM